MQFETAKISDLEQILEQIEMTSAWLKTKGIFQWLNFPVDVLHREISNGEYFVLRENEEITASVVLSLSDELWAEADDDVIYLRRMIAPEGRGKKVLDWSQMKAEIKGAKVMRLASDQENRFLRSYYEAADLNSKIAFFIHPTI